MKILRLDTSTRRRVWTSPSSQVLSAGWPLPNVALRPEGQAHLEAGSSPPTRWLLITLLRRGAPSSQALQALLGSALMMKWWFGVN